MEDEQALSTDQLPGVAAAPAFQVVTVTSNKGGVGKTTIAANLAVYLRALREDLPILYISLDDQPMPERMFGLGARTGPGPNVADALRAGSFESAMQLGEYGVHYVASSPDVADLKAEIQDPLYLREAFVRTGWRGVIVVDTKGDFEILTQNAIAASDLAMVVVSDEAALLEARRVFDLLEKWQQPRERARIVLSLVDRRIRYREGESHDILSLLVTGIRREGYPLFESFLSRSPKVESLYTNPQRRAISIMHGARGSAAHNQMRHLTEDVLSALASAEPAEWSLRTVVHLEPMNESTAEAMRQHPLPVPEFPFRIGRRDAAVHNDLMLNDYAPFHVSRSHVALVEHKGRIGVVDVGSKLGSLVNGQRLGGPSPDKGPIFLAGQAGTLVLGGADSPFQFRLRLERVPQSNAPRKSESDASRARSRLEPGLPPKAIGNAAVTEERLSGLLQKRWISTGR